MPDPSPEPVAAGLQRVFICRSDALGERAAAVLFDIDHLGDARRGFVLRMDGRPVAYLNSCRHVPVELDWQPGQFLDDTGQWIICSVHGAVYDPATGLCVSGPCMGRRLWPITVTEERDGVYWYPTADFCAPLSRTLLAPAAAGSAEVLSSGPLPPHLIGSDPHEGPSLPPTTDDQP